MLYLHDVWVNWFESEKDGYNVFPFHEWRRDDEIGLLDQVPIIYMDKSTYQYIENDLKEIPRTILDEVYQQAYIRRGKSEERFVVEYCFIATDGENIITVDTMGYLLPVRKSRLIPRHERLVYDMIEFTIPKNYNCKLERDHDNNLSIENKYMIGLTRREKQLKQLLFMILNDKFESMTKDEIRYWLTEWNHENYSSTKNMEKDIMKDKLKNELLMGWTKNHEEFCEKIVKGEMIYEKAYALYNVKNLR